VQQNDDTLVAECVAELDQCIYTAEAGSRCVCGNSDGDVSAELTRGCAHVMHRSTGKAKRGWS